MAITNKSNTANNEILNLDEGFYKQRGDSPHSLCDLSTDKRRTLVNWCMNFNKIKSFNLEISSYGIKHIFEKEDFGFYITNGQLKGAMMLAGFNVKNKYQLNWIFNTSNSDIKAQINKINNRY